MFTKKSLRLPIFLFLSILLIACGVFRPRSGTVPEEVAQETGTVEDVQLDIVPEVITATSTPEATFTPEPSPTPEDTPTPTATIGPMPSISGVVEPWTDDTPIAGRHLALCKVNGSPENLRCDLMDWSIRTGSSGEFEFFDIPAGLYLLIHDSGIGSFEDAIKRWGGSAIRSGDPDWCDEYYGYYGALTGWVTVNIPKGLDINMEYLRTYSQFTLGIGESPFILAHYPGVHNPNNQMFLRLVTIDVVDGKTAQLSFPITYYGK